MEGKYQNYSGGVDSKVDWIGNLPRHWDLVPMRAVLNFRNEKNTPLKTKEVLSLSIAHGVTQYSEDNRIGGNKRKDDLSAYKLAYPNDIVMNSMNIIVGAVGVSKYFGAISPVYYALYTSNDTAHFPYYAMIFHNAGFQKGLLRFGKGILIKVSDTGKLNTIRMKVSQDDLKVMLFPKPPLEEQQKIAYFLDHETAKIDTLIEKQQKLIKLLKEKRQAVISHAVTKGLNSDVPMRDSGVEWLGKVPEHWVSTEIRYIASQMGGGTPSKERSEFWSGDIPWVSPKDMKVDYISDSQDKITKQAVQQSSAKLIPAGSILIVVRGMILAHSVPVAITEREMTINQDMKALMPEKQMHGEFLLFFIQGLRDFILDLVEESAHGTKCLRSEEFERMKIAVPKLQEQVEIVAKLKEQLIIIDKLIGNSNHGTELLKERRTALISAAVTGKIDVRNWSAPNA